MEVQDGFILGIFNYCDRWCERCPFTNRCRLFADMAEIDFEQGNGPLTEPRVLRERRRMREQLIALHEKAEALGENGLPQPGEPVGHLPAGLEPCGAVDPAVLANSDALRARMKNLRLSANPSVRLAMRTIDYFSVFVPMKLMRAFSQVAHSGPGEQQSDANGCGKAALLGLERMASAWRTLVDARHVSATDVAPFLAEIARMERNVGRALPNARGFVRPGFDEPDEVRMLDAREC